MSNPEVANVLKTGAIIYYAPVGEAEPDETTVVYGDDWGGNWARMGYTKAPTAFGYEDERAAINVEEELSPIDEWRTSEDLNIETVLAELTADYLRHAAGYDDVVSTTAAGAGQKGFEEMSLGGEVKVQKYAYGLEGLYLNANGDEEPVRIFVWKATAKLNGQLEFSKKNDDSSGGIPLQLHALTDTTQSAGEKLFTFQRVTAEASS